MGLSSGFFKGKEDTKFKSLDFKNPIGLRGKFLTVRKGERATDFIGEDVALYGNGKFIGWAECYHVIQCRFEEVLNYELRLEHDQACRHKLGLMAELKKHYSGFDNNTTVTLIYLKRKSGSLLEFVKNILRWE